MKSKTLNLNTLSQLPSSLEKCLEDGFQPTLALVFSSIKHDLKAISQALDKYQIKVAGCSTAGEIHNDTVNANSIAILLLDMNPDYFALHFTDDQDQSTYQAAYDIGAIAKERFANPAIIMLSGGIAIDAEQIIFGVKDAVGQSIPMYGGLAADDLSFTGTYVFTNQKITNEGLLALIIDQDKISVEGMVTCGWKPVGGVNVITKAKGNILYAINNEPALDVFIRYFGFFDNSVQEDRMGTISGQYPLQVIREGGYSVLRAPLMANEGDRSLTLAGGVREGDQFRFSISPGFEVIEQTVEEFGQLNHRAPQADAVLLFSCTGRHAALGPLLDDEVGGIYNYWKTPMIGFLTYGEIGNIADGECEFHNETCSLVVFKEL